MKYSRLQIFQIVAAGLFLVGAIFMLVHTFADEPWSFWVGLGFAVVAAVFYLLIALENRGVIKKKLNESSYPDKTDNSIEHEKTQNAKIETAENK